MDSSILDYSLEELMGTLEQSFNSNGSPSTDIDNLLYKVNVIL